MKSPKSFKKEKAMEPKKSTTQDLLDKSEALLAEMKATAESTPSHQINQAIMSEQVTVNWLRSLLLKEGVKREATPPATTPGEAAADE